MTRQVVDSTTMRSVGYALTDRILEIEFHSGDIYQYLGVPSAVHKELMEAESKGQYFNREIRDRYPFVQVHRRP